MPYGYYYPPDLTTAKASDLSDMTKWVSYTPVFTGFGTVSNVNFRSRRLMDSVSIIGSFNSGTPTSTEARFTLGFAGISGNITTLASMPALSDAGYYRTNSVGDTDKGLLAEPGVNYLAFGNQGALINSLVKAVASLLIGNNGLISIVASIPIEEWK